MSISLGSVERLPSEAIMDGEARLSATAEQVYLFWENIGAVLVRGGYEIIVDPLPGVEDRVLRPFVLGWALAALLNQRGLLTLHASAVAITGGAVAFLGGTGQGKSTLAAALHARGHSVMADDVTAIKVGTLSPIAFPGFPSLRLRPETAAYLGDAPETPPLAQPHLGKRQRRVVQGFPSAPLPLKCIYVLAEGKTQKIEPIRPREALVELVRHSYSPGLHQLVGASSHFLRCTSIVKNVPIRSLRRTRALPTLPDLARLVEEDVAQSLERGPDDGCLP